MNKNCSKKDCDQINPQPLENFNKDKSRKDGLRSHCRVCDNKKSKEFHKKNPEYSKNNYQKNIEYYTNYNKEYHFSHREEILKRQHKNYEKTVDQRIAYMNKYTKERIKVDPLFRLKRNLRTRLNIALKRKELRKNSKFNDYIGCSQSELMKHLESQFEDWMNWDNYGKYSKKRKTWNIDHIIPLSSAKTEEEMYKLCHYTNLKPLLALSNLQKSDN